MSLHPHIQRVLPLLLACCLASPIQAEPIEPGPAAYEEGKAKNVILFLGDGMGVSTITAARILAGEANGKGAANELTLDTMPFTAMSRTYSLSHTVTDSAAGMNALTTGIKTWSAVIAMDGDTDPDDRNGDGDGQPVETILEQAIAAGKSTGIVTSARVTHATPASCYAHINYRNKEDEIADQLIPGSPSYNTALGDGVDVVLGGGREHFQRDDTDLTTLATQAGYAYVESEKDLQALNLPDTTKLLGLFTDSHLNYEFDRPEDGSAAPPLPDLAMTALEILQRNEQGYFLMIESGRIDHAHHANHAHHALRETIAFDEALRRVIENVNLEETIIIVTADHSHVMTIAGYAELGVPILGLGGTDTIGYPYTTISYANGPSKRAPDRMLSEQEATQSIYKQESMRSLFSETHGGEDVTVWAVGAGSARVRGTVPNNRIYDWMIEASDL